MRGQNRRSEIGLLLVAGVLTIPQTARAYTDPGTGALVWQLLLGAGFAALFYIRKIGRWVSRRKNRS